MLVAFLAFILTPYNRALN